MFSSLSGDKTSKDTEQLSIKLIEAVNIADSASNKLIQSAIIASKFGIVEGAALAEAAKDAELVSIILNDAVKLVQCTIAYAEVTKIAKNKVSNVIKIADIANIKQVMVLLQTQRNICLVANKLDDVKKIDMLMTNTSFDTSGCPRLHEMSNLINIIHLVESAIYDLSNMVELLN